MTASWRKLPTSRWNWALGLIGEYEPMEAVSPLKAIEDGTPNIQGYGYDNHNIGPTCHQVGTNDGKDIDEEFEKAAYVHHADFKTHRIQHAPIRPMPPLPPRGACAPVS